MMYRNYKVAVIEIDKQQLIAGENFILDIQPINEAMYPFAIKHAVPEYKMTAWELWFKYRMIPSYRKNIGLLQKELGTFPQAWLFKGHGASLTDGYWLRRERENILWEDISYFDQKFDNSIGNLTFKITSEKYGFNTPDITTGGAMPKTWRYKDGKTYLIKHGSAPDYLEPYNEKLATEILKRICPVSFVEYDLLLIKGCVCSICENFMTPDLELVTAADLTHTDIQPSYLTTNMYVRERCKNFEIPGYKSFLDYLHFFDYIIDNKDRNLGNYGFLYSPEKLSFLGPAPIYDNGASFWTGGPDMPMVDFKEESAKAKELITDLSKHFSPELAGLNDLADIVFEVYEKAPISEQKVQQIVNNIDTKLNAFEYQYEKVKHKHHQVDKDQMER